MQKSRAETKETKTEVINGDMVLTFYSDNVAIIVGSNVTKGKDEAGLIFTSKPRLQLIEYSLVTTT